MSDIQKVKIEVAQLELGMFVADLDRPWEGTPFMLQGFVINDDEQLEALRRICVFVFVDRTKSIGNQFAEHKKLDVSVKREGSNIRIRQSQDVLSTTKSTTPGNTQSGSKVSATGKPKNQASFHEILRSIRNGEVSATPDGAIFNMRYAPEELAEVEQQATQKNVIGGGNLIEDIAEGTIGFFKGLFGSSKKNQPNLGYKKTAKATTKNNDDDDTNQIIIYEDNVLPVEEEIAVIYPVYEKSQIATKALFQAIANEQNLDLSTVNEVLDSMVESIGRTPDALLWLSKLKNNDDDSYNHALNVSINMMAFGSFLALPHQQIKDMGLSGLLQDLGKLKIPKAILNKTTKLTPKEYEVIKTHVDESLNILEKTADIPSSVILMVSQHHERIDGSGYPFRLFINQIGLPSQIAGLIDTYCALTTNKCYAKSLYNQQALDEIYKLRGKTFTEQLVDQLIQFLGIYPVSSLVELNTGEVAVVIQQNQVRRLLPRVMIILGADKVKNKMPTTINLLLSPLAPNGEIYRIKQAVPPNSFGLNPNDFYI